MGESQELFKPADPYGITRSIDPKGVLPQQATRLNPDPPLAEDEILIRVESLNIDSASFHQIRESCGSDPEKMKKVILEIVSTQGKHQNPVTGSGGMLIGTVEKVGPKFPVQKKPVQVGDRIATLVSLTLTPLRIFDIKGIDLERDRVDVEATAILFATGVFSILPQDIPERVALAVLDVAGAPAQTRRIVKEGDTVVVIGGGGKSGVLCLYEAKRKKNVTTIAIDYSEASIERLKSLSFVDEIVQVDAREAVTVLKKVQDLTHGKMADVVINVANIPNTEMSCILSCKSRGLVYFFSMATSFTKAALGAEGVGADVDLMIGNGYADQNGEISIELLRESHELRELFEKTYG